MNAPVKVAVDARRINSMALHLQPEEIAVIVGMPVADVIAVIRRDSRVAYWAVRCHRTGRIWTSPTERGAYLRAQLRGLTDYDLYGVLKSA